MANIQIRIDDTLKNEALAVVESLGLDLSSAIRMFLAQMVKENGFPFLPTNDPSCISRNRRISHESAQCGENGGMDDFYLQDNIDYLGEKVKLLKAGDLPLEKHDLIE